MPKNYQVVHTNDKKPLPKSLDIAQFPAKDGQVLLPMLDLLTNAECALDDLIHTMGRATIEAILMMSAAEVAGPKQQAGLIGRWIMACLAASMRIRPLAIRVVIRKLGEKGMAFSAICRHRLLPLFCREIAVNATDRNDSPEGSPSIRRKGEVRH